MTTLSNGCEGVFYVVATQAGVGVSYALELLISVPTRSFPLIQVPPQFTVDSSTGVIKSYQEFDYDESPRKYTMILTATDKGHPPLTGSVVILLVSCSTPSLSRRVEGERERSQRCMRGCSVGTQKHFASPLLCPIIVLFCFPISYQTVRFGILDPSSRCLFYSEAPPVGLEN